MPTSSTSQKAFVTALRSELPPLLPQFLRQQRWFGGKARTIDSVEVSDVVPFCFDSFRSYFVLAQVNYTTGPAETYDIPLFETTGKIEGSSLTIRFGDSGEEVLLQDALAYERFLTHLLDAIAKGISFSGAKGQIRAVSTAVLPSLGLPVLTPTAMNAEQSNSSVVFEKRLVMKIFRRVEEGLNPDLEIGSFLTETASFPSVPPLAGYLEYLIPAGNRTSLAILQGYVANQGDAWQFTLRALAGYYDKALQAGSFGAGEISHAPLVDLCARDIPDLAIQRVGPYLESAALLGRRTAELHLALASAQDNPDFAPEPFSGADDQARVGSAIQLLRSNFELLRRLKDGMPDDVQQEADKLLKLEEMARRRFEVNAQFKWSAMATRIHGDYHLGQVLFTGNDFVIIDFEGEPARPLAERRLKRSPLQDVAGMLRSFHYAAYAPLLQQAVAERSPLDAMQALGGWAQYWQKWVSATFLKAYLDASRGAIFIPEGREELSQLLDLLLLDKAVYELGYELNNRPSWIRIPLDGISQLLHNPV